MDFHERRLRLRDLLAGGACLSPASVYDPLSARAAAKLGFEFMMLAGSVASATVLGAPDLVVLTLTELAEQVRRITRAAPLPLLVDADHGYGNALNVARCLEELEAAGVAALTIEDTLLPRPFAAQGETLISMAEAIGKLRAAVEARTDPALVVLARTGAVRAEGLDACLRRVEAYEATGVDGFFFVGIRTRQEIDALRAVTSLPFALGSTPPELHDRALLARKGVRIILQGHTPFQAAVQAMVETLQALHEGRSSGSQSPAAASGLLAELTEQSAYEEQIARYLMP